MGQKILAVTISSWEGGQHDNIFKVVCLLKVVTGMFNVPQLVV